MGTVTEDERRKRLEDLRERMRRTDERVEAQRARTAETLALIDRTLERLRAAR